MIRAVLLIAWYDCLVRFRSVVVLLFLVVLPLAMTVVTGFAFKGLEPENVEVHVAVVAEDGLERLPDLVRNALAQSHLSGSRDVSPAEDDHFHAKPAGARLVVVDGLTADEARERLLAQKLDGVIILPQGFAEQFSTGQASLHLVLHAKRTVKSSVVAVAFDHLSEVLRQGAKPAVAINTPAPESIGEPERLVGFNSFSQAVAGNGVMFILLNCTTAGGMTLVRERRRNTLARMLIAPVSPTTIIAGKMLGVFYVGLAQAIVVFGFGAAIGVFRGVNLVGVVLVTLLVVLVGCAMGLVISAVCRREETAESLGVPLSLVLTALGGGLFPVDMAPSWMKYVAYSLPSGWAMNAYHDLIWRGLGLAAIWPYLVLLAVFALVFMAIGAWKLRWE